MDKQFDDKGLISMEESRHDYELEYIAKRIQAEADSAKVVLIGGASSAGKTTFAKRTTFHLNRNGIGTLVISTDDYFVGDKKNPIGDDGKPDYEHIRAIDLERLNSDLSDLIAGKKVFLPHFDFASHEPSEEVTEAKLGSDSVIIIEGLHSLNEELTPAIPDNQKFLILADTISSPFSMLQDAMASDGRLIRRIIRDSKYRGRTPENTILLWDSVCEGEEKWIRPFVGNAEFVFDTTLSYEPMVLKRLAIPLLAQIPSSSGASKTARRLEKLLSIFRECGDEDIPGYSILREYIGGSVLKY